MQESTVDTKTIHSCLDFATDFPALPNAANYQLARLAHTARNQVHRSSEVLLHSRIRLIEMFQMLEGSALGGHDMDSTHD